MSNYRIGSIVRLCTDSCLALVSIRSLIDTSNREIILIIDRLSLAAAGPGPRPGVPEPSAGARLARARNWAGAAGGGLLP